MTPHQPAPVEQPGTSSLKAEGIAIAVRSQQQEAFWALDRLQSNPSALNIAVRWRLEGVISPALVERAFQHIVARHEVLRTGFDDSGGTPVQRILPTVAFRLAVVDLSLRSEADRMEKWKAISENEAHTTFNLNEPPLLRATLVTFDERTSMLLVTAHHTVCDGWSVGVLSRDFGLTYDALQRDSAPALPPLQIQYADFAMWQRECLAEGDWTADREYWGRKLAGVTRFVVPPDGTASAPPHSSAPIISILLARNLTDPAQLLAKTQRCSFFSLALATLLTLLHRMTGETDIIVGTQVAGRDEVELEELIGVFINTLPLRANLSGNPSFLGLLEQVQGVVSEALVHQHIPAADLAKLLKPSPEVGAGPLAVNFIFQRSFIANERYGGFSLVDMPSVTPGALYDLNFFMVERPEGWRASCEYNGDLYTPATIESILRRFQTLLGSVTIDPDRSLADLPLLIADDKPEKATRQQRPEIISGVPRHAPHMPGSLTREDAEQALAKIWCDLFSIEPIDPDANFFDLGGHSLLAARMLARVESQFGKRLGFATLIDAPTLRGFAANLAPSATTGFAPDVRPIHRGGSGTPILAVNYSILFNALSGQLAPDYPFTTFQLPGFDDREHLATPSFDEIVQSFMESFNREHPDGPIVILGFCGSAPIAFEAARRLREQNREVSLLVLIGSWAPGYVAGLPWRRAVLAELAYRIDKHRIFLKKLLTGRLPLRDYLLGLGVVQNLRLRISRWLYQHKFTAEMPLEALDKAYPPYLKRITGNYRPKPYDGPMLVLRATEEPSSRFLDPAGGWGELARGPLEIQTVVGDHLSIFQGEGVIAIAEYIRARVK
jgi:thioesterase domain-containing protein/acyl carrier protein